MALTSTQKRARTIARQKRRLNQDNSHTPKPERRARHDNKKLSNDEDEAEPPACLLLQFHLRRSSSMALCSLKDLRRSSRYFERALVNHRWRVPQYQLSIRQMVC